MGVDMDLEICTQCIDKVCMRYIQYKVLSLDGVLWNVKDIKVCDNYSIDAGGIRTPIGSQSQN